MNFVSDMKERMESIRKKAKSTTFGENSDKYLKLAHTEKAVDIITELMVEYVANDSDLSYQKIIDHSINAGDPVFKLIYRNDEQNALFIFVEGSPIGAKLSSNAGMINPENHLLTAIPEHLNEYFSQWYESIHSWWQRHPDDHA